MHSLNFVFKKNNDKIIKKVAEMISIKDNVANTWNKLIKNDYILITNLWEANVWKSHIYDVIILKIDKVLKRKYYNVKFKKGFKTDNIVL